MGPAINQNRASDELRANRVRLAAHFSATPKAEVLANVQASIKARSA